MKNKTVANQFDNGAKHYEELFGLKNAVYPGIIPVKSEQDTISDRTNDLGEILFITSYPPRVCGIATYSQDLIKALNNKFCNTLSVKVCALESGDINYTYPGEVKYILKTSIKY
jgi:hypothetical protein